MPKRLHALMQMITLCENEAIIADGTLKLL